MTMETISNNVCCRVCLKVRKRYKDLLRDKLKIGTKSRLLTAFLAVTGIHLTESDSFSLICIPCISSLKQAFDFRQVARKSDLVLREAQFDPDIDPKNESIEEPQLIKCESDSQPETPDRESDLVDQEWQHEEYLDDEFTDLKPESDLYDEVQVKLEDVTQNLDAGTSNVEPNDLIEIELNNVNESPPLEPKRHKKSSWQKFSEIPWVQIQLDEGAELECDICTATFTSFHLLHRHIRWSHMSKKPFVCPAEDCDMQFRTIAHRRLHMKSKHTSLAKINKRTICEICGSTMKKAGIKEHMKTVHRTDRPFYCNFEGCGRSFKCANVLGQHIACVHSTERKYNCDHCGKSFKMSTTLHAHIRRMHTQRQCIKCDQCNKYFLTAKERQLHVNEIHLGLRSFGCNFCESAFKTRYHLNRHMRRMHPVGWKDLVETGKVVVRQRSKVNDQWKAL